jgi:hypothetical protein
MAMILYFIKLNKDENIVLLEENDSQRKYYSFTLMELT